MFKLSSLTLRRSASAIALAAGLAIAGAAAAQPPATTFHASNPLNGVNTGNPTGLKEIILYPVPQGPFCTKLEKLEEELKFSGPRADAAWNVQMISQQIRELAERSNALKSDASQQQAAAAQAQASGDMAGMAQHLTQQALDNAAIAQLAGAMSRWHGIQDMNEATYQETDQLYQAVKAIPSIACGRIADNTEFGMVGPVTGPNMLGSLKTARETAPAPRVAVNDGWGAPGESGNRDGVGILSRPFDRPFDGSEAERQLREQMEEGKHADMGGARTPMTPTKTEPRTPGKPVDQPFIEPPSIGTVGACPPDESILDEIGEGKPVIAQAPLTLIKGPIERHLDLGSTLNDTEPFGGIGLGLSTTYGITDQLEAGVMPFPSFPNTPRSMRAGR